MMARIYVLIFILLFSTGTILAASTISFTANPATLQSPLTQHLAVRCGLTDGDAAVATPPAATPTPASSVTGGDGGGLVGRSAPDSVVAEDEDATAASAAAVDKVIHVTSVTVSHNDHPIATITTFTPAQLETGVGDLGKVKVTGDVSSRTAGELGFIQLDWTAPSSSQGGGYQCDISGITEAGHNVRFSKSLDVTSSSVALEDIAKEMSAMKATIVELEDKVKDYQTFINDTMAAQQSRTNNQQIELFDHQTQLFQHTGQLSTAISNIGDLQKEMSDQTSKLVDQSNQLSAANAHITALQKSMTEALHIESGLLDCGSSSSWTHTSHNGEVTGTHYNAYKPLSQRFKTQYTTPPVVFLSLRFVYVQNGKDSLYGFVLRNVTSSGFDMMCESHDNVGYNLNHLEVSWLSVGAS